MVNGDENSADTYRNSYRHALLPLKAGHRTVVRLDHPGKVATTAHGSSAKNDDVDVLCQLTQHRRGDDNAQIDNGLEAGSRRGTAAGVVQVQITEATFETAAAIFSESL